MDIKNIIDFHLNKIEKKYSSKRIKGNDLINITASKQLNLFIIKNIYDLWISNFEKNKIEYFDYESPDVVKASEGMMNTLSNNISIDQKDFKSLLESAYNEIIDLAINPKEFIKKDLIKSNWYDESKLEKRSKYYIFYKELFQILIKKIKENNEISIKVSEVINYIDEITIDINEDLVKEVSDLIGCEKNELRNKTSKTDENYYSYFSLSKKEIDNLILEATSKSSFEEAASLILKNLKSSYSENFSTKDIRRLLHIIKEKFSLPT